MIIFLKRIALVFIFAGSFQSICTAQNDYQRSALWAKEIAAFADADTKELPKKGKVLFLGSSSIRGWRTLKEDFPEVYIINRGFGGSHFEDVNFYASQIVFPYKPKLIVLYAGENDVAAGKTLEAVYADFKKFVSSVRTKLPKTRLIVVSVKPSPARREFAPKYRELNGLMRKTTEADKHLSFVDVWTPMLDENGEPKKDIFLGDQLHLNREGYKIRRAALLPFIENNGKSLFR